ncbi:7-carboxy-7-deazaguanine synthase (Cx14CxxC type) [Bradyrhizobium diazoefficiens]
MSYAVKEIFLTLQGEGAHAGRASVFCRFAGCNLWSGREADRQSATCKFCDTDFVGTDGTLGGRYASAAELADTIAAQWTASNDNRYVVLTGGEPLLQVDDALIDALHARGFEIGVETNGTIAAPDGLDWICVSPKGGSELVLRRGHELKLVYPQALAAPENLRGPRLRALLAAADGRARGCREHRARDRLLPAPSAMAAQRADAQIARHQIGLVFEQMWELTKSFRFEAAHSLSGTTFGAASEEIHGHSFRAEVTVRGTPDPATGMVVDLGLLQRAIEDVRLMLDHKFLNKIEALGKPTLENLSRFVWERLQHIGKLTRVSIHRDSCNESCTYYGPQG